MGRKKRVKGRKITARARELEREREREPCLS